MASILQKSCFIKIVACFGWLPLFITRSRNYSFTYTFFTNGSDVSAEAIMGLYAQFIRIPKTF